MLNLTISLAISSKSFNFQKNLYLIDDIAREIVPQLFERTNRKK